MTPPPGRFLTSLFSTVAVVAAGFMFAGGDWSWLEGWIFVVWFDVLILINGLYLYYKDPALLAERSKRPGSDNQKPWDTYVLIAIYVIACVWIVLLPLDAERFRWSPPFPGWLKVVGGLLLLPALYFMQRATMDNTFMSTMVRIQDERHQRVVSAGSYAVVRHPLYFGCLLMMIGVPLLVGSLYGLVLSLAGIVILVVRIIGEEAMLSAELEGYQAYKQKVRYRLVPLIW